MPDPAALRARAAAARDLLAGARAVVVLCREVPWTAAAADAYRGALDEAAVPLGALLLGVDAALLRLGGSPRARPPTVAEIAAASACWGRDGRSVRVGGGGFVSVDPDALADAAGRLAQAARDVAGAHDELRACAGGDAAALAAGVGVGVDPVTQARALVAGLLHGRASPAGVADRLAVLAASTRAAAEAHATGDTLARRRLRALAAAVAGGLGGAPALVVVAGLSVLRAGVAALAVAGAVAGRGPQARGALADGAARAASAAVAAGGVEALVTGVAAGLRAAQPGVRLPSSAPVAEAAPLLAAVVAARVGPRAAVAVADPPSLPPPRGLADLVRLVGHGYDPGVAPATVTVQRLDRPDGTRAWVVAVPGTQSAGLFAAAPTDMGTNLRLEGGLGDDMTAGVLAAMAASGIGPDEPVLLAGHSQGGMVAAAVASLAVGTYRVAGVVTAGSPEVPRAVPASVPVVRLEHDEDAVPQLDGEPTAVEPNVTRASRALDGALPGRAHRIDEYVRTAELVDRGAAASPGSVPGADRVAAVLGAEGAEATTTQFRVTREAGKGVGGGW